VIFTKRASKTIIGLNGYGAANLFRTIELLLEQIMLRVA